VAATLVATLAGAAFANHYNVSCAGDDVRCYGTSKNDAIRGSSDRDVVFGKAGRDDMSLGKSNDTAYGGAGEDGRGPVGSGVYGGAGNDRIFGEAQDDTLTGGPGEDDLDGGLGDDSLNGHYGDDTLVGGEGNDTLYGWYGGPNDLDEFRGGPGDDVLRTADNAPGDVVDCGEGNDRYTADPGDEVTNCETDVTGQ
jgi:serralysin